MTIALATDHAGYEQAKELLRLLETLGHEVQNFGPSKYDPDDDYPDFITPAARAVAASTCEFGIILGGSGQGEAMVANKIKGIRCSVFYGPVAPLRIIDANGNQSRDPYEIIRLARRHNNANMLSLAARFVPLSDMKHAIKLWLETPFGDEERHNRRNDKLDQLGG